MRSLACWTSEPKRASLARRWTSSVSAALSSASETSVASAARLLCSAPRDPLLAGDREQAVRLAADREREQEGVHGDVGGNAERLERVPRDRRRGVPGSRARAARPRWRRPDRPRSAELRRRRRRRRRPRPGRGGRRRSSPASARAAASAAWQMSARLVAATRSAPGGAEDPLARDGALLLAHETGHARHDEAEQEDRGDVDDEARRRPRR